MKTMVTKTKRTNKNWRIQIYCDVRLRLEKQKTKRKKEGRMGESRNLFTKY